MGNIISTVSNLCNYIYDHYYPKSEYVRPAYVLSACMLSKAFIHLTGKQKSIINKQNNFVFLASTGTTLGLQIWISFVSGMTMIKLLPRHQFGQVQSKLFPKYFFLTSLTTFLSFMTFLHSNPTDTWKDETLLLGGLIGTSFLMNILNFSIINIKTLRYNLIMHDIERRAGVGSDVVGRLPQGTVLDNDPEYNTAKKRFVFYHGLSLISNIVSFGSTIGQFYVLANKNFFSF